MLQAGMAVVKVQMIAEVEKYSNILDQKVKENEVLQTRVNAQDKALAECQIKLARTEVQLELANAKIKELEGYHAQLRAYHEENEPHVDTMHEGLHKRLNDLDAKVTNFIHIVTRSQTKVGEEPGTSRLHADSATSV